LRRFLRRQPRKLRRLAEAHPAQEGAPHPFTLALRQLCQRIPELQALGLNRIVCQFDDPMRDAGPFMKNVIRPLRESRMIELAE